MEEVIMKIAKILRNIICILAFVTVLSGTMYCSAAENSKGINVEYHTEHEIRSYLEKKKINLDKKSSFAVTPSASKPYKTGKLSDATLKSALNIVNAVRYIAGIDDNLKLNNSYNEMAQAAALLNAANKQLSHYPSKPSGISSSIYNLGYQGASSSNLAWSSWETGFGYKIVHQWMDDGDASNIDRVGHRRWILHPPMKKIGFGQVNEGGTYAAMYAFDNAFGETSYYGVAWPAQNMPLEFFGDNYPWSISMGKVIDASKVKVTLVRKSDNKKWVFSKKSKSGYFNVENSNYGQNGCIIFRPNNITYKAGDKFTVNITGLDQKVSYEVKFFSLNESCKHSYGSSTVKQKATLSANGKITAVCKKCGKKKNTIIYKASTVSLSEKKVVYNGKEQKPSVVVKDSKGKNISSKYYTVTYENTKEVGIGSVTVNFKGRYSGTKKLQLKIYPKQIEITDLQATEEGFEVNYSKGNKDIANYQLEYSTSSKFTSGTKVDFEKTPERKETITELKAGKTYYVRIRCYKEVEVDGEIQTVYSKWSSVKKIKIKK